MIGAINSFQMNRPAAAQAVRFQGIHPDASMGVEVKVAGVQSANENTSRLWFKLQRLGKVASGRYDTQFPLKLIRDTRNPHDPNAIAVYYEADAHDLTRRVGYVPRELAEQIAPLMDNGHRFEATLTRIKPYKRRETNEWFHSMEMRLEYVAKPGRAPNRRVRQKLEKAFEEARAQQQYQRVLGLRPEEMKLHELPGEDSPLVEQIDHERGEASYFRKGHLMAKADLSPDQAPQPTYERETMPEAVKAKIRNLLDRLA